MGFALYACTQLWPCVNEWICVCIVKKRRENECTSTFAWYAIGGSSTEDHPPEERAVGDVLLGPGCPQPAAPAAVLPAHPGHVQHLAPPVLPLLQPTVPSCKHTRRKKKARLSHVVRLKSADPDAPDADAARIIRDAPSLPPSLSVSFFSSFFRLLTLAYPICD